MSVFRVYIIDATTGREMTDHPAHGRQWMGTSGNTVDDNGQFIRGTAESFTTASHATLTSVRGERLWTRDDFDRDVVFKVWYPGDQSKPARYDWRLLVGTTDELTDLDRRRAARCQQNTTID